MRGVVQEAHVSAGDARLHGLLGRFDDIGSLQRLLGSVLNGLLGLAAEVEQSSAQAGLRVLLRPHSEGEAPGQNTEAYSFAMTSTGAL